MGAATPALISTWLNGLYAVRCPLFVARQWFRHRIGSFNEVSLVKNITAFGDLEKPQNVIIIDDCSTDNTFAIANGTATLAIMVSASS